MGDSIECYGKCASLRAEATTPREKDIPTLTLDVALLKGGKVEKDNKISIQLSTSELPILCGVLSGLLPRLHFQRPGKGIKIERQDNKVFVHASQGKEHIYALPVNIGDTFRLTAFALNRLKEQSGLNGDNLTLALRGACALYKPLNPQGI